MADVIRPLEPVEILKAYGLLTSLHVNYSVYWRCVYVNGFNHDILQSGYR